MIPDNQTPRKRPYVLLPPVASKAENAALHGPSDYPTFNLRFALEDVATATVEGQVPVLQGDAVPGLVVGGPPAHAETDDALSTRAAASKRPAGETTLVDGLVFTVLLSVIGSTAGYYFAGQWTADSLTWSVVGGAAGLLLGGGLLLWTRRTR